jgi:hypothetical protein
MNYQDLHLYIPDMKNVSCSTCFREFGFMMKGKNGKTIVFGYDSGFINSPTSIEDIEQVMFDEQYSKKEE